MSWLSSRAGRQATEQGVAAAVGARRGRDQAPLRWGLWRLAALLLLAQAGGSAGQTPPKPWWPETRRRLEFANFNGWELSKPPGSNALESIIDIRAGVPYPLIKLKAFTGLGTDAATVRIRLVMPSTSSDLDCQPGRGFGVPHLAHAGAPATAWDGLTPARPPAYVQENSWEMARFPYGGTFEVCYYTGSVWYHLPGHLDVQGADSNMRNFWCVASADLECRLPIEGFGIRLDWLITLVNHTSECGNASAFQPEFHREISTATQDASRMDHSIGRKLNDEFRTYKVCYCPGFSHDPARGFPCTQPEDFVQLVGWLYAARVGLPKAIYPLLLWELVVHCGAADQSGCPMTQDLRFRLVDPAPANDAPWYDSSAGCRTAPQTLSYSLPRNCQGPTHCMFQPTDLTGSAPKWSGIQVLPSIENHAQKPVLFDVCFCTGACSQPASWFKVDQISSSVIEVLPRRMLMGRLTDFQIFGPRGSWSLTGDHLAREMKLLFDPDGTVDPDDCFLERQDSRSVSGHYCYNVNDCKPPSLSSDEGQTWRDVKVHYSGMYAVCYCDARCGEARYWSFLKWHLVAGPFSGQSWEFSRGVVFGMRMRGWGLASTDRLRIIRSDLSCGTADAVVAAGVDVPSVPAQQLGDATGTGVRRLFYTYDGTLVTTLYPHGLAADDYVTITNVSSQQCGHCAELFNMRPHKVVRVVSPTEFVVPVKFALRGFPVLLPFGATWARSSEVFWAGISTSIPGSYSVCWGGELPTAAEDFSALAGSLSIFEPPILATQVHLTSVHSGALAPIVIAFETRHDKRYSEAEGSMQLKVYFADTTRLAPGFAFSTAEAEVTMDGARQHVCGKLFKELWSADGDGFPMPKGCFYQHSVARKEYSFLFSRRNGLKAGTSYQIVMDARAFTEPPNSVAPRDGVLQLWSMDDVDVSPFGVVELGPAKPERAVVAGASGVSPRLHILDGVRIRGLEPEIELHYDSVWEVPLEIRAASGTQIRQGNLLRVFLFPLTQWDIDRSCSAVCRPHQGLACSPPVCVPEAVVPSGSGSMRNALKFTFSQMDPITDINRHTLVLSRLRLPPGGFFATNLAAELQAADGERPSFLHTSGSLIFAKASASGSVISGAGDGEDRPFRGGQGNTLYARLVLGASIWAAGDGEAGFELRLPAGYRCAHVDPAEANLTVLTGASPQGRGEIGLDGSLDGYWLLAGQACIYRLRSNGVLYAGSAVFLKLTVNNPIFTLQRLDAKNVWTISAQGRGAPFMLSSQLAKTGGVGAFVDRSGHFRRNVPVLGKLRGVTASPSLLGAAQDRNWLSVFFTTEQGSPDSGPQLVLQAPSGFGFLPRCMVEALPAYHYASMSSRQTGLTRPTLPLHIVRCEASKVSADASHLSKATMTLSRYERLKEATTYAFRIMVFNSQTYAPEQHDGFRLTTRSSLGDGLDSTEQTIRFLAADGDGYGTSFGVYRLAMSPGSFVVSVANMLPYSETGLRTRIIVFPIRVPFATRSNVDWRIVAPHGYEWDFSPDQFVYRKRDLTGATSDLPIRHVPTPPALPPKNVLAFSDNFQGLWIQIDSYGFIARIRVPDETPRSSVNAFYIEFGYSSRTFAERYAGASYEAPQVRALVNTAVDYQTTNLVGQQNRLLFQVETITNLLVGGGLVVEAPEGFVFDESCAILDNPTREDPWVDLRAAAALLCIAEVPFTTRQPLVKLSVIRGEVRAAKYEFMIDAQNPTTPYFAKGMIWSIFAYSSIPAKEVADLSALVDGFPIEEPMGTALVVDGVNFAATGRDDHPGQRSSVTLAFQLNTRPPLEDAVLTVKAPLGFTFGALCQVVVGDDVFGQSVQYPVGFVPFEATAAVTRCEGVRNTARIFVAAGLQNLRKYAFRIEVFNPEVTPQQNRWTVSFGGESAVPFFGYRLWTFTEVIVAASHAARSTPATETKNTVSIQLRPANVVPVGGYLAITAPFGFRIPTVCSLQVHRLGALGQTLSALVPPSCRGAAQPNNGAELHVLEAGSVFDALQLHRLQLEVVNPLTMPVDPGVWRLQSYRNGEGGYSNLLDVGEAASFAITEVFHELKVTYPPYVDPLEDKLELHVEVVVPHAIELGDVLEIHGPDGYDFAMAPGGTEEAAQYRGCRGFLGVAPEALPTPACLRNVVRFAFQTGGIALDPVAKLTPAIKFGVHSAYPRRTLSVADNLFHGEHRRGTGLLSSKTAPGQPMMPRLLGLSVTRLDSMISVQSPGSLQLAFFPSQHADALHITSATLQGDEQDLHGQFLFSQATVKLTANGQDETPASVVRANGTMILETPLRETVRYVLVLQDVLNPARPGRALWTLTTFVRPQALSTSAALEDWLVPQNQRDRSENFAGPATRSRIAIDRDQTVLAAPFFDTDATELSIAFQVRPLAIPPAQFLILQAPIGYTLIDRSFKPGDGFPLVSGVVYARPPPTDGGPWAYVVQMTTRIQAEQVIKFGVRVHTPRTPEDLALWESEHSNTWLLMAAEDPDGLRPTASNDRLFPGFPLLASFGRVRVLPEPNGLTPRKRVAATVDMEPRAALRSLIEDGSVHVRITAPLGFDFDLGCLAVMPNPIFSMCQGFGQIAVLRVRDATLPAGRSTVMLWVTNAALTPAYNVWILESFVDTSSDAARVAPAAQARQKSVVAGYAVRDMLQATIGGNTQRGAVTTVFVWFVASRFLDVGGAVELHAPRGYELRCQPKVQYITFPPGTCLLKKGALSAGDVFHDYLVLTLTMASKLVYPNVAYEFGVSAVNAHVPAIPNYWGLIMLNPRREVVDASMNLEGYQLTDYGLLVHSLLATSSMPAVVSYVSLALTFQKELPAGLVGHIVIRAPTTTKVLCQRFTDVSGGGSAKEKLRLDPTIGMFGTHSCRFQNTITLHLLQTEPLLALTHVLKLGVLNPGIRAARDYWAVELLPGDVGSTVVSNVTGNSTHVAADPNSWFTARPVLQIEVPGYGISGAFSGPTIRPYAVNVGTRPGVACTGCLLLLTAAAGRW